MNTSQIAHEVLPEYFPSMNVMIFVSAHLVNERSPRFQFIQNDLDLNVHLLLLFRDKHSNIVKRSLAWIGVFGGFPRHMDRKVRPHSVSESNEGLLFLDNVSSRGSVSQLDVNNPGTLREQDSVSL